MNCKLIKIYRLTKTKTYLEEKDYKSTFNYIRFRAFCKNFFQFFNNFHGLAIGLISGQ